MRFFLLYRVIFFSPALLSMTPDISHLLKTCKQLAQENRGIFIIEMQSLTYDAINFQDESGKTALHYAARFDRQAILIDLICIINPRIVFKTDKEGMTPLHESCLYANFKGTKKLLENNANPNMKTGLGKTPAHKLIFADPCPDLIRILKILKRMDANFSLADNDGNTPLHLAIRNEKPELCRALLDLGADWQIKDNSQMSSKDLINHLLPRLTRSQIGVKNYFNALLSRLNSK